MANKKKKLVLFDGSSLAFRAFYGLHDLDSFINKDGLHTNALYAFHLMLTHVLKNEKPTHALVAWDAGKTTFRTEMYEGYKGGRASAPSEFKEQMPFFNKMLDGFGIYHYELANYEADDIIGTYAVQAPADEYDIVIISGDKDLTQLASENVTVKINRKGVTQMDVYTPATIQQKWGISPKQIIDMKGLMGDSSDNYPGVTGIGQKTAQKLVQDYGSVEGVYDHIDDITGKKRRENLIQDKDNAFLSKQLAIIKTDIPVEPELDDLELKGIHTEELASFYRDMDFNKFLSELYEAEGQPEIQLSTAAPEYTLVEDLTEDMLQGKGQALYCEMFEKNYHDGIIRAVAWGRPDHIYVAEPDTVLHSDIFKNWARDRDNEKIVFDGKRTRVMLHYHDIDLEGVKDDVLIGSYLVHAKDNSDDVACVAREFDITDLHYDEDIYGKGKKAAVPENRNLMYQHLAKKIEVIHKLVPMEKDRLQADSMEKLYLDMEMPLSYVLSNMEITGIKVDTDTLKALHVEYDAKLEELVSLIYQEAGHEFNINSTQQLSDVLFEEKGLPHGKKTKSGHYSTAQSELEKLEGIPIVDLVLEYRQLAKLQSTYVEGILDFVHEDDSKVHTRFTQTLTSTGRLSSVDPNLQNIPAHSEEGRKIRKAFIPSFEPGQIFSSDYSQIELRVLAHMSGDEHMIEDFKEGKDIHRSTAAKVYHKNEKDVTAEERSSAKAVNFGIVYGISDYGLSQNLKISRKKAQSLIDGYFEIFPKVHDFMNQAVEFAREHGYVETLFGRRRYLPDIHAKNYNKRSFAERTAINSPIQGTAADIIKIAMVNMDRALRERHMKTRLLLQVHDELIFEVPNEELEDLSSLVKDVMENAVQLDVPLVTENNYGPTWYDAK